MSKGPKITVNMINDIKPEHLEMAFGGESAMEKDIRRHIEKLTLNSIYPKFAHDPAARRWAPIDFGEIYPTSSVAPHIQAMGRALRPEPLIPALEVPEAPVEPEPVLEPESSSVQLLRKLLADRRAELSRAERDVAHSQEEIEETKQMLALEEADLANAERHVEAAQASIDEILADIKKLGGRPEVEYSAR